MVNGQWSLVSTHHSAWAKRPATANSTLSLSTLSFPHLNFESLAKIAGNTEIIS
ncbi:hypothetical protein [Nostoc sp. TCL26-01]|uniref:hypothetical protein n=1 Tax=Nostoc sp. TCL26-01 TaxID=2576904 RepID=UPI0015B7E391|nr:hypothetical protein [Nostoc sp. TCL26-01]